MLAGRPPRVPETTMLPVGALLLGLLVVCGASSLLPKHQQRALLVSVDDAQTGSGNLIQQQHQQHQASADGSSGLNGRFATLINEANLNQQWADGLLAGPQLSKRARKMSAFMPMRGRKDGRDALDLISDQASAYRENDAEPTIVRLIAGAGSGGWPAEGGGGALHWLGPRQFANQLALRNQQAAGLENVYEFASDQQDSQGPQMMQAKLRRAFHPMRGKKSGLVKSLSEAEAMALAEDLGI